MGNQLKNSSVGFFPMKYFLVLLVITVLGIMTGTSCEGFLGGFVVCTVLGLFYDVYRRRIADCQHVFRGRLLYRAVRISGFGVFWGIPGSHD